MIEWLFNDRLYQKYLEDLEHRSDSQTGYFPTCEGWQEYKKAKYYQILGETTKEDLGEADG